MKEQSSGHYVSFNLIIRDGPWKDGAFKGQVIMSDGRKIGLAKGTYGVRVWVASDGSLVRGSISHEQFGQRIHFQSGDRVFEFIQSILVHDGLNFNGEVEDPPQV